MGIEGIAHAHRAAERVARERYGLLLAFLAARTRDVAGAEDALGDAFAAALRTWPDRGVPANPDAWLLTAARHRQTVVWYETICSAYSTSWLSIRLAKTQ